ncbi:MAG: hypothetical protein WCI17_04425 [bacterium]|jgi:hypothetical protein
MKMVVAMLLVFILTGAVINRISRWTIMGMVMAIVAILILTRLTF